MTAMPAIIEIPQFPGNKRIAVTTSWDDGRVFVRGHSYEFADRKDWDALPRLFKPLAGKPDVWYCTSIELFDYHAARRRLVLAADPARPSIPAPCPLRSKSMAD